jgi:hypothetical protein
MKSNTEKNKKKNKDKNYQNQIQIQNKFLRKFDILKLLFILNYLCLCITCDNFLTNKADFLNKRIQILDTDTVIQVDNARINQNWANLKIGGRLIVKIKACRDTGKNWYFKYGNRKDKEKNTLNPLNLNHFNSGQFINELDGNGHLSSNGYFYFIFKPNKIGEYKLYFIRRRPFELLSKRNKILLIKLRVRRDFFDEELQSGFDEDNLKFGLKHGINKDKCRHRNDYKHDYPYSKSKIKHRFNKDFSYERKPFKIIRAIRNHRYKKFTHCFK